MTSNDSLDHQTDPYEGFPPEGSQNVFLRNPVVVGGIIVVLLVAGYFWTRGSTSGAGGSAPIAGTLLSGQGTKRYDRSAADTNFVMLPVPTEVKEGDWLVFGDSTDNVLIWPNKSSLRFAPGSAVTLTRIRADKGGGIQYALEFTQGRMWVKSTGADTCEIIAKEAVIKSNPGAVFEVSVAVDAKAYTVTTVKVYSGSVDLGGRTKSSDHVTVNSPQFARVNDDRLFPAESFDVAQNDAWENWNLSWTDDARTAEIAASPPPVAGETPVQAASPGAAPPPGGPPVAAPPGAGVPGPPPGATQPSQGGTKPGKPAPPPRPPSAPGQPAVHTPVFVQPAAPPPTQPVQQQPQPVQQPAQPPPAPAQTGLPPPVYAPGSTQAPPAKTPPSGTNPEKQPPPPGGNYPGGGQPGAPATVMPDTRPIGY